MLPRIIATVFAFGAAGIAHMLINSTATIASAEVATDQFKNSDAAAMAASTNMALIHSSAATVNLLITLAVLAVLVVVWAKPMRARMKKVAEADSRALGLALLCAGSLALVSAPAHAFYATTDVTEVVYILPNWSAFFIPDTGANKDSQATFGSVDYLNGNKIAAKRFIIPHAKLSGTGGTALMSGPDFYVPTGRMIIVDRTPFYKEFVDATDRGTSIKKQGFMFETKDSVNIGTGITISAYVTEQNAATFLYWFGTKQVEGDLSRPEVQFQSVIRGMSLADVMDGIVRAKIQESLASEFGKLTFDQAIAAKATVIKAVSDAVKAEFEPKGISIGFLGFSGPLNFSDEIQASIDRTVIASRDKASAEIVKDALPVLQQKVALEALVTAVHRWNGVLPAMPSVIVVPDSMTSLVGNLVKPATK